MFALFTITGSRSFFLEVHRVAPMAKSTITGQDSQVASASAEVHRVGKLATDEEHVAHCKLALAGHWKKCPRCSWIKNDGFKRHLEKALSGKPNPFKDKLKLGINFADAWGGLRVRIVFCMRRDLEEDPAEEL